MTQPLTRHIEGTTALVTGANRGLGKAFVQALLDRGAAKVYAAARDPGTIDVTDARVGPVQLDITNLDDVVGAARDCTDVSLLINNAGAMLLRPFLSAPDMSAARTEMETNYFGTLAMARAFAPVLGAAGGGSLVNMLSVVSWYAPPFNASYCASKSAQWALTNALRVELRAQGTLVVGVHAGFIDTDMAAARRRSQNLGATGRGANARRDREGAARSIDRRVDSPCQELRRHRPGQPLPRRSAQLGCRRITLERLIRQPAMGSPLVSGRPGRPCAPGGMSASRLQNLNRLHGLHQLRRGPQSWTRLRHQVQPLVELVERKCSTRLPSAARKSHPRSGRAEEGVPELRA